MGGDCAQIVCLRGHACPVHGDPTRVHDGDSADCQCCHSPHYQDSGLGLWLDCAVKVGHIDCVLDLLNRGHARHAGDLCATAAGAGQLDCLALLHTRGFPWNERTCANASEKGQLACLEYAHKGGCPWNEDTVTAAIASKNLDCGAYALANGCPSGRLTVDSACRHEGAGYHPMALVSKYPHLSALVGDVETHYWEKGRYSDGDFRDL